MQKQPFVLILLYAMGLNPTQMIGLGFSPPTVYRYKRFFEDAKKTIQELNWKDMEKNYQKYAEEQKKKIAEREANKKK